MNVYLRDHIRNALWDTYNIMRIGSIRVVNDKRPDIDIELRSLVPALNCTELSSKNILCGYRHGWVRQKEDVAERFACMTSYRDCI
jgi:hypothetical protein